MSYSKANDLFMSIDFSLLSTAELCFQNAEYQWLEVEYVAYNFHVYRGDTFSSLVLLSTLTIVGVE